MKGDWSLALDQGTTSSRAIVFDGKARQMASKTREFRQIYPRPGWVEHDPWDIWRSQRECLEEAVKQTGPDAGRIAAIGITNQRETAVVWDRRTGEPVYNAIVWQCRRTADYCTRLREEGWEEILRQKTGLVPDAYFTATKVAWILDHVPGARSRADQGDLVMGTVDTWLIWNLTGGKVHATDYTNASRTLLFNIHTLQWDGTLLKLFGIPEAMLPDVRPSGAYFGETDPSLLGRRIPIHSAAGDQQAALFGQACFSEGDVKNTYGTGCFLLMNTGKTPVASKNRLLTTLAASLEGEAPLYALEGSVFMGGASLQWLRDELGLLETAAQSEDVARQTDDTGGVYLVPAFTGLGAPWWDMYARGMLLGMTRGTGRPQIVRAALESIAYQSRDVMEAMQQDFGRKITSVKADGGASANGLLMQFQADIANLTVRRPREVQTTALGAAYLAGLSSGIWKNREEILSLWELDRAFTPHMAESSRVQLYGGWLKAVRLAIDYAKK